MQDISKSKPIWTKFGTFFLAYKANIIAKYIRMSSAMHWKPAKFL